MGGFCFKVKTISKVGDDEDDLLATGYWYTNQVASCKLFGNNALQNLLVFE